MNAGATAAEWGLPKVNLDSSHTAINARIVSNPAGSSSAVINLVDTALSLAGLMPPADKSKLDTYPTRTAGVPGDQMVLDATNQIVWETPAGAAIVNLATTGRANATLDVKTDTGGTNAALPIATDTLAGIMSGTDKAKLNKAVKSDTALVTSSAQVINMVSMSQADYDALGVYDAQTMYVITA